MPSKTNFAVGPEQFKRCLQHLLQQSAHDSLNLHQRMDAVLFKHLSTTEICAGDGQFSSAQAVAMDGQGLGPATGGAQGSD